MESLGWGVTAITTALFWPDLHDTEDIVSLVILAVVLIATTVVSEVTFRAAGLASITTDFVAGVIVENATGSLTLTLNELAEAIVEDPGGFRLRGYEHRFYVTRRHWAYRRLIDAVRESQGR